jgi:ketosteroid isomerase-like protein
MAACAAALCLTISAGKVAGAPASTDKDQIIQLERDWVQSWVTMDAAANDRIIADDFLGTEPDGKRVTKADMMEELKADPTLASNHLNEDDLTIRFYGDTAVVIGSESWKLKKNGETGRYIWTDIFVKRNGKWQVVASQDMEKPDP